MEAHAEDEVSADAEAAHTDEFERRHLLAQSSGGVGTYVVEAFAVSRGAWHVVPLSGGGAWAVRKA